MTDLNHYNLLGRVKSITETIRGLNTPKEDKSGLPDNEKVINPEKIYYEFNKEGNLIELEKYYAACDKPDTTEFVYSKKNGKLLTRTDLTAEGEVAFKYVCLYDRQGRKTRHELYAGEETVFEKGIYEYTAQGLINSLVLQYFGGVVTRETRYKHNQNGQLISETDYSKDDGIIYRGFYKYKNGKCIECYSDITTQWHKIITKYNDREDETEKIFLLSESEVDKFYQWEYIYDNQKNWVKRTFAENLEVKEIVDREIGYYD